MAEAHSAVGFQFTVTPDGIDIDFNRQAFKAVVSSGRRSWRKRLIRFFNRYYAGVYPARAESYALALAVVLGFDKGMDVDVSRGYIARVESHLPSITGLGGRHYVASALVTGVAWVGFVLIIRYVLKGLYSYQGWMTEGRGKKTLKTRIWGALVWCLSGRNPLLYSFQGSLPKLPVPPVGETLKRYLRSVRPLLNDDEFADMEQLANEFQTTIAGRLQKYLVLKSWWATNYVSDWWEEFVYLHSREPIMVNSNFYAMDLLYVRPTNKQTARAATLIQGAFRWRSKLDKENVRPLMVSNMVPLCSYQYERQFNTTRIPGVDKDKIVKISDSRHIAVHHKGRWFKVYCYYAGRLLTTAEIEQQLDYILENDEEPDFGEADLAALTAGKRVPWADVRRAHFQHGVNGRSLKSIESAAFCVSLDEDSPQLDNSENLAKYAKLLLHGQTTDRWFDKTFTMVIFKNGVYGANVEHSWADAPIFGHLLEEVLFHEFSRRKYNVDGSCDADRARLPFKPEKLKWEIDADCFEVIEKQKKLALGLADDVDMYIMPFGRDRGASGAFGKRLIKKCGVSPDAFVQLALQLANFRDQGSFSLTYEASMTRLFREGRTETVRSCTNETAAFVNAMVNKEDGETCKNLLRTAAKQHVSMYQAAMMGKGVDRHLFTLYVVSRYLGLESKFLDKALTQPWKLSTSQTPHSQANLIDFNQHPTMLSAGGGFGPVSDNGYGVSYIICHEDLIMFHISSKKSCGTTNSEKFARQIEKAMLDIAALFN